MAVWWNTTSSTTAVRKASRPTFRAAGTEAADIGGPLAAARIFHGRTDFRDVRLVSPSCRMLAITGADLPVAYAATYRAPHAILWPENFHARETNSTRSTRSR